MSDDFQPHEIDQVRTVPVLHTPAAIHRPRSASGAMWGLVGAIGGCIIGGLLVMQFARPKANPSVALIGRAVKPYSPPTEYRFNRDVPPPAGVLNPVPPKPATSVTVPPKNIGKPVIRRGPAFGTEGLSPAVPGISGSHFSGAILPGANGATATKISSDGSLPTSDTQSTSDEEVLVSVVASAADPKRAAAQIAAQAKALHGFGRVYSDYSDEKDEGLLGIVAYVPPNRVEDLLKMARKELAVIARSSWTGNAANRQVRMSESIEDHLYTMERKKQVLLVKYMDDAPEVVDASAVVDKLHKSLARLRRDATTDRLTAVKFEFTKTGG